MQTQETQHRGESTGDIEIRVVSPDQARIGGCSLLPRTPSPDDTVLAARIRA